MKKSLFLGILLSFFLFLDLNAQNYYQPNFVYIFESRSTLDSNKTSILKLEFDNQGKAYLSRSVRNYEAGDTQKSYVMAPAGEVTTDYLGFEISGNLDNYWIVPICTNDPAQSLSGGGDRVEIWCECKRGNGTCSVSFMLNKKSLSANCVADAGCWDCVMKTEVKKRNIGPYSGGIVLLKAISMEWRN